MIKFLSLYLASFKISFRAQTMYRSTYFLGILGQWIGYGATFVTLYVLVSTFETLNGWTGNEVMVLYGLSLMSYAIAASIFWRSCSDLALRIRSGEFDSALTKPLHPFMQMLFRDGFNMGYVSHFTVALVIVVAALCKLEHSVSPTSIAFFVLNVLGASLVQSAALIAASAMSFFTVGENPVMDFLVYKVKDFTNYPITIFPRGIQFILTFILPFAFINFYPSAVLLGKAVPAGYPAFLPYLSFPVGAGLFVLSLLLWNWGLTHYKSTGS